MILLFPASQTACLVPEFAPALLDLLDPLLILGVRLHVTGWKCEKHRPLRAAEGHLHTGQCRLHVTR